MRKLFKYMRRSATWAAVAAGLGGAALAHDGQHPGGTEHLLGTGAFGNVELIGKVTVHDAAAGIIADVGALGNFAYLGGFSQADCAGPEGNGPDGGVYVIDISNPASPKEVGFIKAHQDTFVGEGVQALHIETSRYTGDILVLNNEGCGKNYKAGFSIWNINNPRQPLKLSQNQGDFTSNDSPNRPHDANQIHSAFAWDAGNKAYLVIVDDDEAKDIDLFDITNPRKPRFLTELDATVDFPINPQRANGAQVFLHDMVVKEIGGRFYMLMSYWDAGWIILDVTNPAVPVYVGDSDYPDPDPLVLSELGLSLNAEGNAHEAEWSHDNTYFLGTDEDFSPFRAKFSITSGPDAGEYSGGEFGFTKQIALTLADGKLNGPTVFGGYGCLDDVADIPPASVLDAFLLPGDERILTVSRGPVGDPNHNHDACRFDEKIANADAAGYDAVIIANHHVGAGAGADPDAAFCGGGDPRDIMGVCMGHRAYHLLFGTVPNFTVPYPLVGDPANTEPLIGTIGERVEFTTTFDGWGYVRLIDATTFAEVDGYAIPEAFQQSKASGFGALSVHEVATDPDSNNAYIAYYAGGFRAVSFGPGGIVETGGYLDPAGNDFWGVQVWTHPASGVRYVLASDRDTGLWIFKVDITP